MKPVKSLVMAAALSLLLPVQANAVVLQFRITGLPGTAPTYQFSFQLDTGAVPNFVTSSAARFNGTPFTYTRPNGGGVFTETGRFDGPTFFTTLDQGGVAMLRLEREPAPFTQFRLFGPQLFTGPTTAPVFTIGNFDLASTPRNAGDPVQPLTHRLSISVVPEPASWAMLLAGFAAVGAAARQHRSSRFWSSRLRSSRGNFAQ